MRKSRARLYASLQALAATMCIHTLAQAADGVPKSLMADKPATKGTTDVAAEGFQKTDVRDADTKDATELQLSAGALSSTGNARMLSLTGSGRFRVRRDADQFSLAVAANQARSAPAPGEPQRTTLQNIQGKARYDRFLGSGFAVFVSLSGRSDKFQGLLLRENLDPGLAYYFVDQKTLQLWAEAGYDYQHDLRRQDTINAALLKDGTVLAKTDTRHSSRLFLGFSSALSDTASLSSGLEYLQGLSDSKFWRMNWDSALSASISSRFSLAATFTVRYDHAPLPGIQTTDTITAANLVYTLL